MDQLRKCEIVSFGGSRVAVYGDCMDQTETVTGSGEKRPTGLPKADMLYYRTENGSTVIIRPSGTEPKVKAYILVKGAGKPETDAKIAAIGSEIKELFA